MRNWLKDPVFLEFGRRRQEAVALGRDRERRELEVRLRSKRDAQIAKAQDVIDKALDRGDEKVALAILRPFLARDR
jgi:hypothetical protein